MGCSHPSHALTLHIQSHGGGESRTFPAASVKSPKSPWHIFRLARSHDFFKAGISIAQGGVSIQRAAFAWFAGDVISQHLLLL